MKRIHSIAQVQRRSSIFEDEFEFEFDKERSPKSSKMNKIITYCGAKAKGIRAELKSASHEGHKGFAAEFSILPSSQFSRYRSDAPSDSPVSENFATFVTSV